MRIRSAPSINPPLEFDDTKASPEISQPEGVAVAGGVEPSEAPNQEQEDAIAPAGYSSLGVFDPFEAERLLKRFFEGGVRFLIDRMERAHGR